MNILVDCSYIGEDWKQSDSLVIYAARLIEGLAKFSTFHTHILIWQDKEDYIDNLLDVETDKIVLDRNELITKRRPYYRLTRFLPKKLKKEIKKRNITAVLLPMHCDVLFYYPRSIKHYAIAHDMFIYDMNKRERNPFNYYFWFKYQNLLTKKFTRLISISRNTRDEILNRTGIDSDVVYNCIPFNYNVNEKSVENVIGRKYILDVNRYTPRKNPEVLIYALALIRDKIPHVLYLKGAHDYDNRHISLGNLVAELGLEGRVIFDMDYRTEGEMRYLYSHADLFVSPSLKEGFGWTPIEAAILKPPVLVSDIEVFREVTCNKLTTFDPHSPEDLAKHIFEMLKNPPSEQEREEIAEFFLERYSLKNQIEQLVSILERDL